MKANDPKFVELMLKNGKVRCPRCGRMMPATLAMCPTCMWNEMYGSLYEEAKAEDEWREKVNAQHADWLEWQQERAEMAQCGGF